MGLARFETSVDDTGAVVNNGCGGVVSVAREPGGPAGAGTIPARVRRDLGLSPLAAGARAVVRPTTVAGGMVFNGHATDPLIQVRDAATGLLITTLPLPATSDSGVAVSRNALFSARAARSREHPSASTRTRRSGVAPAP